MGRLSNLRPTLGTLKSKITPLRDADGHSRQTEPWRAWYWSKRWRDLRLRIFARDLFTCQEATCRALVADTSKLVADHIQPHRGNTALFWDERNLQTLCDHCHSSLKQASENADRRRGGWSKV